MNLLRSGEPPITVFVLSCSTTKKTTIVMPVQAQEEGEGKKKKVATAGDAVAKMKVAMPLLAGMAARPYLRNLLSNYAVHTAAKAGHPIMLVKGQKTIEVSESRLLAERKILEDGDLHRLDKVKKCLEDMRTKRKSAAKKAAKHTD